MRKTTYLERAVTGAILILAAILLLALYPFRLFRREVTLPRDDFPAAEGVTVSDDNRVVQRFETAFEKVAAIEVFVEAVEGGRYLTVHVNDMYGWERAKRDIDLAGVKIPGYVRIPLGVTIYPGVPEVLVLDGAYSSLRLQTEDVSMQQQAWIDELQSGGESMPGQHLRMRVIYDLPVNGKTTLLYGGLVLLSALILCGLVRLFFKRFPQKNRLIVVRDAWKRVIQVLTALFFAALFVLNFPLKAFDAYAAEIIFYAIGILLAASVAFYVIHRLFGDLSVTIRPEWRMWAMSACFALAIEFAVEYVNGFYNIHHFIAVRQLAICLFLLLIAAVFPKYVLRPVSIAYILGAVAAVIWHVRRSVQAAENPPDEINLRLMRLEGAMMAVLGYVLLLLCLHLLEVLRKHPAQEIPGFVVSSLKRISPYALFTGLTAVMLVIYANGRYWVLNLVILWLVFYTGFSVSGIRAHWYKVLTEGVMMHFLFSVLFCLLHRAYQYLVFFRYPFVFTTVTVTGEYLVMVLAVAAVRLVVKLRTLPAGTSLKECFRNASLEFFFFGTVSGYLALTITRLAWISAAGVLLVTLMLSGRGNRLRSGVMMLFAALLLFAPVFTMQRIVPAIVSDHRYAGGWEELNTAGGIMGDIAMDSPYYMRFGRFIDLLGVRLGGEESGYLMRSETPLNYDSAGNPLYGRNGGKPGEELPDAPPEEAKEEPAESEAAEEAEAAAEEAPEDVRFGGRIGVWKSYLGELNMSGHEGMENENTRGGHAHNTYLQAMFDHGLPAGLLFSAWIGITILTGALHYRKRRDAISFLQTVMASGFAILGIAEWIFHPGNPVTVMLFGAAAPLMTKETERA